MKSSIPVASRHAKMGAVGRVVTFRAHDKATLEVVRFQIFSPCQTADTINCR